jgi:hypothetical protein
MPITSRGRPTDQCEVACVFSKNLKHLDFKHRPVRKRKNLL